MAFNLWNLVPRVLQYRDELAGGSDPEYYVGETQQLKKIVETLELEADITKDEIQALADILDVDSTDPEYLLYLSATIGMMIDGSRTEDFQRWFIKNLVAFYKIKGTHLSWDRQFKDLAGFWYRAWELWKAIPYEVGDWSRVEDYTHTIKAARFDLYYLGSDGLENYLTPSEARSLVKYIDNVRPIHVILRVYVELFTPQDTINALDTLAGSEIAATFTDTPVELEDELLLELGCLGACQLGCQTTCEAGCEGDSCESACQVGACESGVTVGAGGCAATCEQGCQAGSCQSGCQSCKETEVFPFYVNSLTFFTGPPNRDEVKGRAWFPHEDALFPPAGGVGNPWWINEDTIDGSGDKELSWSQVGAGLFTTGTLTPCLQLGDWILVRCILGEQWTEAHGLPGDSTRVTWTGNTTLQPHPCSVRIVIENIPHTTSMSSPASAGAKSFLVGDASGFYKGDYVVISGGGESESAVVNKTSGSRVYIKRGLVNSYPSGTEVERVNRRQMVAHTIEMTVPTSDTEWLGTLGGDVDQDEDSYMNYRGDFGFSVTFTAPPPEGAQIKIYYYPEYDCEYWWITTAQGVEGITPYTGGWVGVDPNGDGILVHGLPQGPAATGRTNITYDARGHVKSSCEFNKEVPSVCTYIEAGGASTPVNYPLNLVWQVSYDSGTGELRYHRYALEFTNGLLTSYFATDGPAFYLVAATAVDCAT